MRRTAAFVLLAAALSGSLVGCFRPANDAGLKEVQDAVRQRSGYLVTERPLDAEEEEAKEKEKEIEERIRALLQSELSESSAVEIALLGNRRFQAILADLGIARADLWQSGTPKNPTLGGEIRFPGSPVDPFEIFLVQNLMDLIQLPRRRELATAVFEQAKLRISGEVFDLVTEVRAAFFDAQAAFQMAAMRRAVLDTVEPAAELAVRQHAAGNITDLQLENEQALLEQARLDLARSEDEELANRERLNGLLGLWGDRTQWKLSPSLPDLPEEEIDLDGLESRAASQRIDLAVARREIEVAARALPIARSTAYELELGVHREREPEGTSTMGPALEFSLPLFDRGSAAKSRAVAVLEQAQQRYAALAVEMRSEVRAARHHMLALRSRAAYYRDVVLPRRARIVTFSQQEYNFMLIGAFQLLQAKRDEITARGEYIEALRDYWVARAELERAVGGRLDAQEPQEAPAAANGNTDRGAE